MLPWRQSLASPLPFFRNILTCWGRWLRAHAYRDRLGKRFGGGVSEPGRGRYLAPRFGSCYREILSPKGRMYPWWPSGQLELHLELGLGSLSLQ
jgi:hypothetical protein